MEFREQIEDVLTQVSWLTVDQAVKDDVENCLRALREVDIKIPLDGVATCANNASLDDIISMLIKLVDIINGVNNALSRHPLHWGNVFDIVSLVCGAVFTTNIGLAIHQTYGELNEEDLMEKCQVFYMRINQCIGYMKSLPDARTLSQEKKATHLQLLATDINIFMGFDEITFLGNSIKRLARNKPVDFDTLMKKVQLYCCLTTLRELFLLYRYGMQLAFNIGADSIGNVLASQRQYDKDVLEFLWKPTYLNAHLIHNYNPNDWPITALFLEKRKLVENLFPLLEGKSFHIEYMTYRMMLKDRSGRLIPAMDKGGGPSVASSVFTLHGHNHNTFSVHGNCYPSKLVYFDNAMESYLYFTSNQETSHRNGMWHVIKIDPDTPDSEPWYMFRLKANTKMCLRASGEPFGFPKLPPTYPFCTYVDYPDKTFFWKLTQVIADDKGEYKEYKTMV